jgi:hypothetical protein
MKEGGLIDSRQLFTGLILIVVSSIVTVGLWFYAIKRVKDAIKDSIPSLPWS